ncbi:MAG: hypothetical protein ABI789_02015 [Usitatibacter sp.]
MKRILLATLAAAFALPAAASDAPKARPVQHYELEIDTDVILADATRTMKDAEQWRVYGEHVREWAQEFTDEMHGSMAFMFSDRVGRGRIVKGAPYSADAVTEMNQTLADGNVISHKTMSRVYRDGEGRTRQESFRGETLRSVYISDPVAGASYTLMPGSKIAVSIPRIEPFAPRAHDGNASARARGAENERRIVVRTVDGNDLPGTREEVRVQVVRIGEKEMAAIPIPPTPPTAPTPPTGALAPRAVLPPIPLIPLIPGVHTMRFESTASLGKGVTSKLGARDFDGVKADGTSTVWTIPAGQVGNRNPINVTKESWYSPELQVTVMTRHNDPRTGESVYRLASIKRAEPSIDLFKVPEGYTVKGRGRRGPTPESKAPSPPG